MGFALEESERIEDDYTLLDTARKIHGRLKTMLPVKVYSSVARVNHNFYITPNLEIAVPSIKILYQKDIKDSNLIRNVLTGGVTHEDGHAYLFPFMTRMNITYAIIHGYVKSRGLEWNEGLFHTVENIVSDVFNELIIYKNKIAGWNALPELRHHYIFKHNQNVENSLSNPILQLLYVHSKVFSSIYHGKLNEPRVPMPKTLAEHLYNMLSEVADQMSVEVHTVAVNSGGLKSLLAPLVFAYDMYDVVDKVYDIISKRKVEESDLISLRNYLLPQVHAHSNDLAYWCYYTMLAALYRYALEHPDSTEPCTGMTPDKPVRPEAPAPDILEKIFKSMGTTNILDPDLADYAAKRLISAALMVSKTEFETVMTSGMTKVPWYRRPRGKIDPRSLAMESVLDWKVTVKTQVPEERKKTTQVAGVPDNITIVLDESGSTSSECTVISPIVGVETKVFDVERVTTMAMLYNVSLVDSKVPANLIRFSNVPVVEQGTVASIYDRLKNIKGAELQMGSTEIIAAVKKALELHKDGRTNYFILVTDMVISQSEALEIKNMIFNHLRRSPVLVVAVNADAPEPLLELNRYRNVAVVGVKTLSDYPSLESAVVKLGRLIYE